MAFGTQITKSGVFDMNSKSQLAYEVSSLHLQAFSSGLATDRDNIIRKYTKWFNDPEVTKYLSGRPADIGAWLDDCAKSNWYWFIRGSQMDLPFSLTSSRILGHIGWKNIDIKNKTAERAIVIGEKRYWGLNIADRCIRLMTVEHHVPPGIETIIVKINKDNSRRNTYLERESDSPPIVEENGILCYRLQVEKNLRDFGPQASGLEDSAVGSTRPYPDVELMTPR